MIKNHKNSDYESISKNYMLCRQLKRYIIPILIPILGIVYGVGDYVGWWDEISVRAKATKGLEKLMYGNGYPEAFIYSNEPEFEDLKSIIDKRTPNPKVRAIIDEGLHEPSLITIEGTYAQSGKVPDDWPQRIFIPESSQIMYIYGIGEGDGKGKAVWVGRASDVKLWIDEHRNRERLWITTILIGFLSLWTAVSSSKQATDRR